MRLEQPFHGGRLYQCRACSLLFRFPSLSADEYEALYEGSAADYWSEEQLRVDQQLLRDEMLALLPNGFGKVLDIGCYDGSLLTALGQQVQKFGIEPSTKAAEAAKKAGVAIVGRTLRDLDTVSEKFDVICAVNVIEHVHRPIDMLATMARGIRPGGHLVISTGDASAAPWRILGPSYWYSANAEHISFISPAWCEQAARKTKLSITRTAKFRYEALPASKRAVYWGELALKAALCALEKTVLPLVREKARRGGPRLGLGRQGMFTDHFYTVFQKV